MKARIAAGLTVILLAVLGLAACASDGEQTPSAPQHVITAWLVETVTPTAAGSALLPLSPEACADLAEAMAEALGVEVTQGEAPFNDPVTGGAGTACQTTATGTGEQFASPDAAVDALAGMLEGRGWTEDPMLAAGGPTGTGSGFRNGDQVCVASAIWHADASANCPQDQPISACEVKPEQQLYTVTLDCATSS